MATDVGLVQRVEDGKLVDTSASTNSLSSTTKSSNSSLDKEAFLQLLVAQMKYQDPLEPTSNTEYISQLATFSSLEEMQNLNSTMTTLQGTGLVGKQVILKVTNNITGKTEYINGPVDYIVRENGKTYLSVKNGLYSIDDLDTVVDPDYLDAVTMADTFDSLMKVMPSKNSLTLDDKEKVELARKIYDSMTDYQKQYVTAEYVKKLEELEVRMKELTAANGAADGTSGTDETDDTDGSGDTGNDDA